MNYLDKNYGISQIEDVKPFHIKHFLLLKQEEGKKPQYINDLLKVYKTFFRYLEEEEYSDFYNFERISLKNGLTPVEIRGKTA